MMDFSSVLTLDTCAKCKICCTFKQESLIYVPKEIEVKEAGNIFTCVHRCENAGCTLGQNKPMECLAWPFSIAKQGDKLLLVLEHSCPEMNNKFETAKQFALKTVAPVLLEYSKQHLNTLREHDEKNKIIGVFENNHIS